VPLCFWIKMNDLARLMGFFLCSETRYCLQFAEMFLFN
jgi:hypothetical protein